MSIINSEHLLDQADRLVINAVGGAPRQTDLRRAISNAYYAIFHAIISEAADDFVGITRRHTTRYSMIYRSVSHRHLRSLCDDVVKSRLPSKYTKCAPAGGFGSDIEAVATALSELQEKRHIADYDPLARTTLSDAKLAIAASKAALGRLRTSNKIKRKAFLSLVVFLPV